ncbi:hypothetical protein [Haladaptatus sp. DFWS20]|uniref:hypothetical protein n=1 Tax=Haladaptatus sp. DFWS20 TaxID=3403467 RepID=UPI003EBECDF9
MWLSLTGDGGEGAGAIFIALVSITTIASVLLALLVVLRTGIEVFRFVSEWVTTNHQKSAGNTTPEPAIETTVKG